LLRFAAIFLGSVFFSLAMNGCATSTSETGPGSPDEKQLQHCQMVLSAIQAQPREDALAALALLQADVSRWQTSSLSVAKALVDHAAVTNAVDKEDWQLENQQIEKQLESLWVFLDENGVEPTNNRSERALRYAVLWRKRSHGTQSDKGNRWVERILSLKQTCRMRALPMFPILANAIRAYFKEQTPDLEWVTAI
jgi:hypothetical protein